MTLKDPLTLLGGLSAEVFMKRHWQKKPLLIRQAFPGFKPLLSRSELFEFSAQDGVESRLIRKTMATPKAMAAGAAVAKSRATARWGAADWTMQQGPFARRALPALTAPGWTLLLQGMDLHVDSVHCLLQRFNFVPQARLDDLMISYATDGGGVGPHFDSYDVFLLQAHGRRRWRIGRQKDLTLQAGVPLKILQNFEASDEFVLEPGDMLYLPPRYAHDGIAEGECMTYSIGFRAPGQLEIARDVLQRLADDVSLDMSDPPDAATARAAQVRFADPGQAAVANPGAIPEQLQAFAAEAVASALSDATQLQRMLGELLTEPKPSVWFDNDVHGGQTLRTGRGVQLDRRTRMMYDAHHVFINGESYLAGGRDASLMHMLADTRCLAAGDLKRASAGARELLQSWLQSGWLREGVT